VLSSTALKTVIESLEPEFERTTHQRLAVTYGTSTSLAQRIQRGERFDLAVLTPELIERLVSGGLISARSRKLIARAPMGMAIRAGGSRPDIGTTEALKTTLAEARSIAYAKEGAAGIYFARLVQTLGIADTLQSKTVYKDGGPQVGEAVASGSAEIGVLPVSEIMGLPGIEVLGRFPADVEGYAVMVGGVAAAAEHGSAADTFLTILTAPAAREALERAGLERPSGL
jgi:molybdate transport system substrate-binding protein